MTIFGTASTGCYTSPESQNPERCVTQMALSVDNRTLMITREDGQPLTYRDCELLFKHCPSMHDKLKHLRVLLR